jgi:hypothetical protein
MALGLPPYRLPKNFFSLSPQIQFFILTNLDRLAYGETPVVGLNPSITAVAEKGAQSGTHPGYPADLPPGWASTANLESGATNGLFAYFFWMYQDGFGGGNSYCKSPSDPNCWAHRHNLLAFPNSKDLAMGAASALDTAKLATFAVEIIDAQRPLQYSYTWPGAVPGGAGSSAAGGPGGAPAQPTTSTGTTTTAPSATFATGQAKGTVLVNGKPLTSGTIPYGSIVDVTQGALVLTTDTGQLGIYGSGVFAAFKLLRGTDGKKPIVVLRLVGGDFSVCKRQTASASTPPKTVRQLWGNGVGEFRTTGRFAAATVRGTFWLTADRCDGTYVKVNRGIIQVSDLSKHRQVIVTSPHSYLAKP